MRGMWSKIGEKEAGPGGLNKLGLGFYAGEPRYIGIGNK